MTNSTQYNTLYERYKSKATHRWKLKGYQKIPQGSKIEHNVSLKRIKGRQTTKHSTKKIIRHIYFEKYYIIIY